MESFSGTVPWLLALAGAPLVALPLLALRPRRKRYARGSGLYLPSAAETSSSVERFRRAAARSELVDFIWERFGPSGLFAATRR